MATSRITCKNNNLIGLVEALMISFCVSSISKQKKNMQVIIVLFFCWLTYKLSNVPGSLESTDGKGLFVSIQDGQLTHVPLAHPHKDDGYGDKAIGTCDQDSVGSVHVCATKGQM